MKRANLIRLLAAEITDGLVRPHPVRVAIDGIDAAGKTTLADELVAPLAQANRQVIRASIDGFHHARKYRYQRGKDSPEGYYRHSFDYEALKESLLEPLGPNGSLQYRVAAYDYQKDARVNSPLQEAQADAILVFDGVFLLRPELLAYWDIKIFIDIGFDESMARAAKRDVSLFGDKEALRQRYRVRYIPGQQLYLAESRPKEKADIIVMNNDIANPGLKMKKETC